MTIKVMTPEHGTMVFEGADGWETLPGELGDEGNLSITQDDETVAEFAKGSWLFVTYIEDPEPKPELPEPRQWCSLYLVPRDVKVRDNDGDLWEHRNVGWCWNFGGKSDYWTPITGMNSREFDGSGPFTEVLDA